MAEPGPGLRHRRLNGNKYKDQSGRKIQRGRYYSGEEQREQGIKRVKSRKVVGRDCLGNNNFGACSTAPGLCNRPLT